MNKKKQDNIYKYFIYFVQKVYDESWKSEIFSYFKMIISCWNKKPDKNDLSNKNISAAKFVCLK